MKVVFLQSPTLEVEKGKLNPDIEKIVQRWSIQEGQYEIDLLEFGLLQDPVLIVIEEDGEQKAYLYGIWKAGNKAIAEMFGERYEEIKNMSNEELKEKFNLKSPKFEGEKEERIIEYPVVFSFENTELADWKYEGEEAKRWIEEILNKV